MPQAGSERRQAATAAGSRSGEWRRSSRDCLGGEDLPSRTTAFDILGRHGTFARHRQRPRIGHPGARSSTILAPTDVWSADFKGQFKTGDGVYCYPLTVTDGFGRHLLGCQGLQSTAVHEAKPVFVRLFREFGLPRRIRTDNGVPYCR